MIELSPLTVTIIMFGALIAGIAAGYPMAWVLACTALFMGFATWGTKVFPVLYTQMWAILTNYILLAGVLFIFMGMMLERTGIANRLFSTLYIWLGGLRGGLAISVILIGTVLAACVGVVAASVVMLGVIAIPAMLERNYSKDIATGAVGAGGTLGILIPPSVMLVFYGPNAGISVGKLFMAAFLPGFMLAGLYVSYIALRCLIKPSLAPAIPPEQRQVPLGRKVLMLVTSLLPPGIIILAVLGTIYLGIATPTEAAGTGAFISMVMALCYRRLNFKILKQIVEDTMAMVGTFIFIMFGAVMFTGVFLGLDCDKVVSAFILGAPFGRWGSFCVIMIIVFILGMFVDWIGIIFVIVPVIAPIVVTLGFDPLWVAMMIIINLQMSFLSPPLAYTIYYIKGLSKPSWGIETNDIIRGVLPYIGLIAIALGLCIAFPQIILWLPSTMKK